MNTGWVPIRLLSGIVRPGRAETTGGYLLRSLVGCALLLRWLQVWRPRRMPNVKRSTVRLPAVAPSRRERVRQPTHYTGRWWNVCYRFGGWRSSGLWFGRTERQVLCGIDAGRHSPLELESVLPREQPLHAICIVHKPSLYRALCLPAHLSEPCAYTPRSARRRNAVTTRPTP